MAFDRTPETLDAAVAASIDQTDALYDRYAETLTHEKTLTDLLDAYSEAICRTQERMRTLGVVAACARCDTQPTGSCCFKGVEGWYEPVILLINKLMGVTVPRRPQAPGQCLFLGERGCRLKARHSFCVNFLCPTLREELGPSGTADLLAVAGRELLLGLEAETFLRRWLRMRSEKG